MILQSTKKTLNLIYVRNWVTKNSYNSCACIIDMSLLTRKRRNTKLVEPRFWITQLFNSEWFSLRLLDFMDLADMARFDSAICNHEHRDYWLHNLIMKAITSKLHFSIDFQKIGSYDVIDVHYINFRKKCFKKIFRISLLFFKH